MNNRQSLSGVGGGDKEIYIRFTHEGPKVYAIPRKQQIVIICRKKWQETKD